MKLSVLFLLLTAAISPLEAQLAVPAGTQVYSYFPQIADGGPSSQKWITTFTFANPSPSYTANALLEFFDNNGQPLPLDLGNGLKTEIQFALGPQGSATFATTGASAALRVGWAVASSSMPLQSVAQYRDLANGAAQQGVSVPATPASMEFSSPATASSGIALANPWSVATPVNLTLFDGNGATVEQSSLTLAPFAHTSFNLYQMFPSLPSGFRGTVRITATFSQPWFVALILSGDGNVLSSYPAAGIALPVSQYERISKIWYQVLNFALNDPATGLTQEPHLVVDPTQTMINSYACPWINPSCTAADLNSVHIFMNIGELLSDSDSELAFVIAHELGHIIQGHGTGSGPVYLIFNKDPEWDADQWGLWLSLAAGYDPYGGTGALGREYTATTGTGNGGTGLLAKNFDGTTATDLHGSLMQRLGNIWNGIVMACAQDATLCSEVKTLFHPHFPSYTPMDKSPLESLDRLQKQPHLSSRGAAVLEPPHLRSRE